MTDDDLRALIDRHLDGLTTPAEAEALSRRLEDDPAARADYLRLAGVHALLAAGDLSAAPATPAAAGAAVTTRGRWKFGLSGLAAGVLVGAVSSSLVWAHARPAAPPPDAAAESLPLADGGFEDGPAPETEGVPVRAGVWGGDFTRVVTAEQGVTPFDGARMLRFLRADNASSPPGGAQRTAEVWQTIDLRPLRGRLGPDPVVESSARFAAAPAARPNGAKVGIVLAAFSGDPGTARAAWPARRSAALAVASKEEPAASRPGAWQHVVVQITLPPDADYLLLQAGVHVPPPGPVEFPGCYLDDVAVRLFPPGGGRRPGAR
ncbi:Uncharacterized protein OS=Pirellula staleyi (strain ATCC 27377 / DSM 6068 / ICPB 4128) GN=Psta_3504 PE=4 SV=1 [Gemmataceae bacterium]|nr:Uncharacterized protein OS=Pirellula staleyi (strain ATCC 27377 / DSM 6068 / ICPB 4128) GN=Psta_3504 PE=4 SV=1 [Gemmataceae bacterium]VTU01795.1 Uncharacterized protein OS=Pirellula staleyi (strain ATCC 27377 / DSM 6068 / ICPB 4128) GN=Psta_3504 PE=4 SV=1 [Gemmataceae bacterium]